MTGTLYTEHYKRSTFVIKFAYPLSKYDKINTIYFSALLIILDNLDISTGKQSKRLFVSKAFYMQRRIVFSTAFRYHALFIRNHFSLISQLGKDLKLETIIL